MENLKHSDATIVFVMGWQLSKPKDGTNLTIKLANQLGKPYLIIDLSKALDLKAIVEWVQGLPAHCTTLNVAGPRESSSPGICKSSRIVAKQIFQDLIQQGLMVTMNS